MKLERSDYGRLGLRSSGVLSRESVLLHSPIGIGRPIPENKVRLAAMVCESWRKGELTKEQARALIAKI